MQGRMGLHNKPIIIDGKDHLLGRLASIVAKQLLQGEKVAVLRNMRIAACTENVTASNFVHDLHRPDAKKNAAAKIAPYQKIIESYGYN
ncbi:hypothetical protein TELCIR_18070 [Teladorsagia circumcincta]|uniref:60S ribosomal protein L13a n=1 Tax=Teladorsagia circumcincta TaxID=45464 RepID=A0A2G9TSI9_TELCI|nr:hypothetical protein TELCIR_18070 [Teladorsagia circumcincta]